MKKCKIKDIYLKQMCKIDKKTCNLNNKDMITVFNPFVTDVKKIEKIRQNRQK